MPIAGGCAEDDECEAGHECVEGSCVPITGGCEEDDECETGHECVEGSCVPIAGGCEEDDECEAGHECVEGSCVPAQAGFCGDGECDLGSEENCVTCPADCGLCHELDRPITDEEVALLVERPPLDEALQGFCAPEVYVQRNVVEVPIKSASDFSSVVYIDPDYEGDGDGSIEQPFSSWARALPLRADTAYLQKRGTHTHIDSTLEMAAGNTLLGAYGEGNKPVISATTNHGSRIISFRSDFNTVRELHIRADPSTQAELIGDDFVHSGFHGVSSSYHGFGSDDRPRGNVIYDNIFYRAHIISWTRDLRVLDNDLLFAYQNGMFIQHADYVEIANNNIYRPNQSWYLYQGEGDCPESDCWGDGIQFHKVHDTYLHNNYFDRSDTGTKAGFISRIDGTPPVPRPHYFECNIVRGPRGQNPNALFVGWNMHNLVYQYNHIIGSPTGSALWSHSSIVFSNNVIEGEFSTPIFCEGDCTLEGNIIR